MDMNYYGLMIQNRSSNKAFELMNLVVTLLLIHVDHIPICIVKTENVFVMMVSYGILISRDA